MNANSRQLEAVTVSDGPVLITAGPGTGKTFTLVQRALYLIEQCGVKPENILIATFTDKAARELITRISDELLRHNITANINDMYIGTFHSICLRLLKEFPGCSRLQKNYRVIDEFDQQYTVFRNLHAFREIDGFDDFFSTEITGHWRVAGIICGYVNKLSEELITPDELIADNDANIILIGKIFQAYKNIIASDNLLDFSSIMAETYTLLTENPAVLAKIQAQISHVMADEYQDTNHIQEKIIFLIAGKRENICVVGDDDQSLYRFRGATVRNILEFPGKFAPGKCRVISLSVNYRSNIGIINFCNKWMSSTSGRGFKFDWDNFRYSKTILPSDSAQSVSSPTVAKIFATCAGEWHEKITAFIRRLKNSGKISDYNQIAFLFRSVKNERTISLAKFLEANGIKVYSPRSDMFFERREIRLALGCLMLMFPEYVQRLENGEYNSGRHTEYYAGCLKLAAGILTLPENSALRSLIISRGKSHIELSSTTDYAYSGLLYELFGFKPFAEILDTDLTAGVADVRPSRNLAKLTQITGKFEYLHEINTLSAKYITSDTEKFFNVYLRFLYDGGITEYEDESEYAPSGCVSFMTIHQAKGLEFPVVFVDSLYSVPRKQTDPLMSKIEERYFKRPEFEPQDRTKYFDFWRLYYTAFSRAQNLLLLTFSEDRISPSKYFRDICGSLPSVDDERFNLDEFTFSALKDVNIKQEYSFTSHITVYETCGLQYKFYRELEFMPVRENAMLFGMLVHETIEDIHRAALRNESHIITDSNIESWLKANYSSLSKSTHSYLSARQIAIALQHVTGYAEHQRGKWDLIQQAEFDVSLVKPEYIIKGKIDLIRGSGDSVEIIDFKSTRKPDIYSADSQKQLEIYRRQLHIYAHLVEQRTGQKVSRMNLYYTGEFDSVPVISFKYSPTAIRGTVEAFDDTVRKIIRKEFHPNTSDAKICANCDFRYYCKIQNTERK